MRYRSWQRQYEKNPFAINKRTVEHLHILAQGRRGKGTLQLSSGAFLCGAGLRFQLHKFLGNLIIGSLRENPQDCESSLIHVNPAPEGAPASTASFVCYVSELHHCYPQNSVLPGKAVIFHTNLELVGIRAIFIPQDAEKHTQVHLQCLDCKNKGASSWLDGSDKSQKTPFCRKHWSEREKQNLQHVGIFADL